MEDEEGTWEGRLSEEIGRERIDVRVVQKPPSEVAATADEEGALAWAPASGAEMVEVGALWGEGREQETAGGLGDGSRERGWKDGMKGWADRGKQKTPTKYGHLGEVESLGGSQTHGRNHASAICAPHRNGGGAQEKTGAMGTQGRGRSRWMGGGCPGAAPL